MAKTCVLSGLLALQPVIVLRSSRKSARAKAQATAKVCVEELGVEPSTSCRNMYTMIARRVYAKHALYQMSYTPWFSMEKRALRTDNGEP